MSLIKNNNPTIALRQWSSGKTFLVQCFRGPMITSYEISMVYLGIEEKKDILCFPGRQTQKKKRDEHMTIPTLDQTEGIWIGRTFGQGYHYVQDVFPGETPGEQWHRANCRQLIVKGHLLPEDVLASSQKAWNQAQRYERVHS
jgi:hypothetical protein